MLKLKESQFCGLSRAADWLLWLKDNALDLYEDLRTFHKMGRGCKANRERMMFIRDSLYKRSLGEKFEQFVMMRYPNLIVREELPPVPTRQTRQNTAPVLPIPLQSRNVKLNKHNVFRFYRPEMLTFPHKVIIQNNNKEELERLVREFTGKMIGVNILTIDDTAYIEYLLPKFVDVIPKLTPQMYETKAYRVAHN
jgi:hypothetical protein